MARDGNQAPAESERRRQTGALLTSSGRGCGGLGRERGEGSHVAEFGVVCAEGRGGWTLAVAPNSGVARTTTISLTTSLTSFPLSVSLHPLLLRATRSHFPYPQNGVFIFLIARNVRPSFDKCWRPPTIDSSQTPRNPRRPLEVRLLSPSLWRFLTRVQSFYPQPSRGGAWVPRAYLLPGRASVSVPSLQHPAFVPPIVLHAVTGITKTSSGSRTHPSQR